MDEIEKIESELSKLELYPMWLGCEYYPTPRKTVNTHLKIVKANLGTERKRNRFKPYYNRLCKILEKSKK